MAVTKKYKKKLNGKRSVKFKKNKRRAIKFSKHFYILILSFIFLTTSFALAGFNFLKGKNSQLPNTDEVFFDIPLASTIYDRNGEFLFRVQNDSSNSDKVTISEINNKIRAVFLAAEDANFYRHSGIDYEAIARCTLKAASAGESSCGGSTITQQMIKMTTKRNDPTIDRKIDEVLLATEVEQKFSKEQILEKYLSVTPYGSTLTGIKTASKYYFNKESLEKLTLSEIAILASLVNKPADLSPIGKAGEELKISQKNLIERRNYVLDQLKEKIILINSQIEQNSSSKTELPTIDEINLALVEPLKFNFNIDKFKAGHFVNYALEYLVENNLIDDTKYTLFDLQTGGYSIYTTLDYNLQQVAEKHVNQAGNSYKYWNVYNAAVMTTSPKNGDVITMVGSKDFNGQKEACDSNGNNCKFDPEVNVLTTLQQPGSTAKPLGYYIGFEQGKIFPGSALPDIPIKIGGYTPKNWDGKFLGATTNAVDMLRKSRNIPALEVVTAIGVDNYLKTAKKFGYTTLRDASQYGPSIILGGGDVYLTEHAQAYGVFANQGNLVPLNPILKIEDRNGNVIYSKEPKATKVGDEAASYLLNQSLFKLDTGVSGQTIDFDGRDIAGKTGTTEENRDALLVIYSPDFVTIGWVGNNNNERLSQQYGWPAFVVAPWLKDYMREIGGSAYFNAKTPFQKPSNVYWGGGLGDCVAGRCRGLVANWLIAGKEPARGDVLYRFRTPGNKSSAYLSINLQIAPSLQPYLNYYYRNRASNNSN